MKLKPHERREKALEKPLINQKLIDYLDLNLQIDSFISQIGYQKKFLYGSYKLRKRLNQPNLDQLIESEVSKFNQELMKEIREIQALVLQTLAKHPDQARLLIYLISVSDVDSVKNNIENLSKFFDFYER